MRIQNAGNATTISTTKQSFKALSLLPRVVGCQANPQHQVKPEFNRMQVRILELYVASRFVMNPHIYKHRCNVRFNW